MKRFIMVLLVWAGLGFVPLQAFAQTAYNLGQGVNFPNTWTAIQTFNSDIVLGSWIKWGPSATPAKILGDSVNSWMGFYAGGSGGYSTQFEFRDNSETAVFSIGKSGSTSYFPQTDLEMGSGKNIRIPNIKSTSGLNYVCTDTNGTLTSQVGICSTLLTSVYGGTGNGFTKFSGPTTSEKTFTLPDASDAIATLAVANTFTANQTISNTAPSLAFTDTTASAKSFTIAVDANLVQLRESAGASGSLMVLDLANNFLGVIVSSPKASISTGGDIGLQTGNNAGSLLKNAYYSGGWKSIAAGYSRQVRIDDTFVIYGTSSSASGADQSITLAQQFTIDAAGKTGIGMTPTVQFELSGSVGQKASGTTWSNPSDARLKENVRDYTDGLDVIRKIRPVEYDLNGLAGTPKGQHGISVIAQEMIQVMPYTIETYRAKLNPEDEQDTDLYRFEASAVTFALVNAVKELAAKVQRLEAQWNK